MNRLDPGAKGLPSCHVVFCLVLCWPRLQPGAEQGKGQIVTKQDPRRLSQNKAPAESSACLLSVENLSSKNKLGDFLGGPVGEDSELPLQGTQVWSWLRNENPTCLRCGQKIKVKIFLKNKFNQRTEKMQKEKENSQTSQNNNTSAIRQSQGPLFSFSSRSTVIVLCLIWELFSRYSNPYQVEEVNCMLPTSKSTPDHLEAEGWWRCLFITSPLTTAR